MKMRIGRESNQGIVFPAKRYKKIPYDMRDLERVIVEMPNETTIDIDTILEDETMVLDDKFRMFEEYNDRRISMMGWSLHKFLLYLGIGGLLSTILCQIVGYPDFIWEVWFIIALPSLWPIYLSIVLPKVTTIVFDREKSTVELPGFLKEPPVVDKFDNKFVSFGSNSGGFTDHWDWSIKIARYNKAGIRNKTFELGRWSKGGWETWSFWVWYMDKNRPLPPGTAFDQYRNADFERRKVAGFPPPLYKSRIPTPEATPAQQEEREKYWLDKDYMVP